MKISTDEKRGPPPRAKAPEAFQSLLRRVSAPKPPPLPRLSRSPGLPGALPRALPAGRATPGTPEALRAVRQALHSEARRLGEARADGLGHGEQRQAQRVAELVARELTRELAREPPAPPPPASRAEPRSSAVGAAEGGVPGVTASGRRQAGPAPGTAELRTEAAMALIERIELFVRSQRPALALSVGGALAATVEVERTGPREVALRIRGHRAPLAAAELAQLRAALEARGLRLRSLRAS